MAASYSQICENARILIAVMNSIYEVIQKEPFYDDINLGSLISDNKFAEICEARNNLWDSRPTQSQCEDDDFVRLSNHVSMLTGHADSMIGLLRKGIVDFHDSEDYETFVHIGTRIGRVERFFGK